PAYDICPQGRTGNEATQAMLIKGDERASTLAACLAAAPDYHLKEAEAAALIEQQIVTIAAHWQAVCDQAALSPVDRKLFSGRQFLIAYAIEGLEGHDALHEAFRAAQDMLINSDYPRAVLTAAVQNPGRHCHDHHGALIATASPAVHQNCDR